MPNRAIDRRSFLATIGTSAAGLAVPSWLHAAEPAKKRLNFVFFLIDDMGWADVGCNGSKYHETPNIDRLAGQGMRFTDAYAACPVCSPTRASIMTGKYPARLHLTDWISGHRKPYAKLAVPKWTMHLPLEEVTLAEAFKEVGYATGFVGKWHLGNQEYYPEHQGFDANIGGYHRGQPPSYFAPYKIPTMDEGPKGEYLTDRHTDDSIRFIEANRNKPFLLYLSHYAVHTPLQAKKAMVEKYSAKPKPHQSHPIYAAMVQSVDESVGRIAAALERLGLADNTAVIFMSDNGGLHRVTSNAPLRAGKGTAYEGGVREPMIVKWPGTTQPGSTCRVPVTSTDFYPTMLEMAGLPLRPQQHCDGLSMVPLLRQTGTIDRDALYWHYPHYHITKPFGAVRKGDWKLIEYFEDMNLELYSLRDDLSETTDLAKTHPQKAEELRKMLYEWRESVGAQMPTPNPEYDPDRVNSRPRSRPKKGKRDREFDVLDCAAVDGSDLGYAIRTSRMANGFALRKLKEPLTEGAVIKFKMQSVKKHDESKVFQNGFLAFGESPKDGELVKCGMHLGGQRNYAIMDGAGSKVNQKKVAFAGDPMSLFEIEVTFDPRTHRVITKTTVSGNKELDKTVELTLDREIKLIRYVGYYVKHAVTAFSAVEVVPLKGAK